VRRPHESSSGDRPDRHGKTTTLTAVLKEITSWVSNVHIEDPIEYRMRSFADAIKEEIGLTSASASALLPPGPDIIWWGECRDNGTAT